MMQATFEGDKTLPLNCIEKRVKMGDRWQLGRHRLVCGDATNSEDVAALMGKDKIDLLLTDPPFFMPASHYQSRVHFQRKFADTTALRVFFDISLNIILNYFKESGHACIFCNADSYAVFYPSIYNRFDKTSSLIWDKGQVGLGRTFRHQHELIVWAKREGSYFKDDGKLRSDVLKVASVMTRDRLHPVEKPIELLKQLIEPLSPEGAIVCDLFGGGGGVLITCENLGRVCRMMELDPDYCDLIISRWEQMTGCKAEILNSKI